MRQYSILLFVLILILLIECMKLLKITFVHKILSIKQFFILNVEQYSDTKIVAIMTK